MIDYLPDWLKTIGITVILALIPVLISSSFEFSLIKSPEIQVTVLEHKDYQKNISSIQTIIQNIGSAPEEKISIVYSAPFKYSLNSYNSTETKPTIIDDAKTLRISIDRMAPSSYMILDTQGTLQQNSSKTVHITTKSKTEILTLNNTVNDIGVTNINFADKNNNPLVIEGLIGGAIFAGYRFFSLHRYEFVRRKYLGVYNLKLMKNTPMFYMMGFAVLYFVGFIVALYDISQNVLAQRFPFPYVDSVISSTINAEQFLEFKTPGVLYPVTNSNLILAGTIFLLLLYSKAKIHLPATNWLRSLPQSKITSKMISGSYTSSKIVSKNTRMKILQDGIDVYVIRENDKIIGLVSQKEISKLGLFKTKLGSILQNKNIGYPKWDEVKSIRDNFVIISEDETLDIVEKKMKEDGKQFAIVLDQKNNFKGVLDYDFIFDHALFRKKS